MEEMISKWPVIFRFATHLRTSAGFNRGAVGFHRWFPSRSDDGIDLRTGHPNAVLRVWFDRKEVCDGPLTTEEDPRPLQEADADKLSEVGVVWSGPLRGELAVKAEGGTASWVRALRETSEGMLPKHREIVGEALKLWLCPKVSAFVDVLRFSFGQYWLDGFEEWDDREESLPAYCQRLNLRLSTDGGATYSLLSALHRGGFGDFLIA